MVSPELVELVVDPTIWLRVKDLIERTWPDVEVWRMPDLYAEDDPVTHTYSLRGRKSDESLRLVHTHGPREGRGLDCGERTVDGRLLGWCQPDSPVPSGG